MLTIVTSTVLWVLTRCARGEEKERKHQTVRTAAALPNFQISQCYFLSAVKLAALVKPGTDTLIDLTRRISTCDQVFRFPVAMNGFVAVVFNLVVVSRHARLPNILTSTIFLASIRESLDNELRVQRNTAVSQLIAVVELTFSRRS